jgi:hypothetical protein
MRRRSETLRPSGRRALPQIEGLEGRRLLNASARPVSPPHPGPPPTPIIHPIGPIHPIPAPTPLPVIYPASLSPAADSAL